MKRDVWKELGELPRDPQQERASWQKIQQRAKPKQQWMPRVVIGCMLLLSVFLFMLPQGGNVGQHTAAGGLQAVYISPYGKQGDGFIQQPSRFYSFVEKWTDTEILQGFERILRDGKNSPIKEFSVQDGQLETPGYTAKMEDATFVYGDGKKHYKVALFEQLVVYDPATLQVYSVPMQEMSAFYDELAVGKSSDLRNKLSIALLVLTGVLMYVVKRRTGIGLSRGTMPKVAERAVQLTALLHFVMVYVLGYLTPVWSLIVWVVYFALVLAVVFYFFKKHKVERGHYIVYAALHSFGVFVLICFGLYM